MKTSLLVILASLLAGCAHGVDAAPSAITVTTVATAPAEPPPAPETFGDDAEGVEISGYAREIRRGIVSIEEIRSDRRFVVVTGAARTELVGWTREAAERHVPEAVEISFVVGDGDHPEVEDPVFVTIRGRMRQGDTSEPRHVAADAIANVVSSYNWPRIRAGYVQCLESIVRAADRDDAAGIREGINCAREKLGEGFGLAVAEKLEAHQALRAMAMRVDTAIAHDDAAVYAGLFTSPDPHGPPSQPLRLANRRRSFHDESDVAPPLRRFVLRALSKGFDRERSPERARILGRHILSLTITGRTIDERAEARVRRRFPDLAP